MSSSQEISKLIEKFEKEGVEAAERALSQNIYNEPRRTILENWVKEQKDKANKIFQNKTLEIKEEGNAIAKQANRLSNRANIISIAALIISFAAIIVALLKPI